MYREFIAHHIKEDSWLEHVIASMQPRKYSKTPSKYSMPVGLVYEELGGLSDPRQRDCSQA